METRNLWNRYDADQLHKMEEVANWYKFCLDNGKTERECVRISVDMAEKAGFRPLAEFMADKKKKKLEPGTKVYAVYNEKTLVLYHIGKESIEKGMNILGAHIDSPRIDVKQNPLYERSGFAYFDTHYYGGIKKYQWVTIPLSLHGVVIKKDGTKIDINIGESESDPVFVISDLLIHLAQKQMKKTGTELVEGEKLDLLVGSRPAESSRPAKLRDKDSSAIKKNILEILKKKYGIEEEDFLSAELEIVPAAKASFVGFDESIIGSYGQDDRVCAYTALRAVLEAKAPEHTLLCVLTDKEETGSDGNTGMQGDYVVNFVNALADVEGAPIYKVLANSKCLSADVNAAFDPNYPETMDRRNSAKLNYGVIITKYTGSGGKYGTSDASAEFLGYVRAFLDAGKVVWQTGNLGKVDFGGGGTIAKYIAERDVETVDVGVPILSMHAPFELSAVNDVYMTYRAFAEFDKK